METELLNRPEPLSSLLSSGKDEMNFAEFPIAMLTDRVSKGRNNVEFEYKDYDERRKRFVVRKRVIEGSEKYGLPTATDDTVVLALIQLTKIQSNFHQREVQFSRRELIEMLGWPDDGRSYRRIKESLLRIFSVNYIYDNSWWDNRQKNWTTKAFHILELVEINDSRTSTGQRSLFPSRIVWNEVVFDSFQAGFLRDIDFTLCIKLEHPIALRIYRILGKRFYKQAEWEFDLKEFARVFVGLGENYEGNAHIARKLKPAIEELESVGFLEPLSPKQRFLKKGRHWRVRFRQKGSACLHLDTHPASEDPNLSQVVKALISRGVSPDAAKTLVASHPMETIQFQIEHHDWLLETKHKDAPKGGGWFTRAIPENWTPPKKFESKAQRVAKEKAKQEALDRKKEEELQQREQVARVQSEREAIRAYWNALDPKAQAELNEAALASADHEKRALCTGPLKEMGLSLCRDAYIRVILEAEGKLPALPSGV